MGAAVDVYEFLVAEGLAGGSSGWQLHRRRQDTLPDQMIVVTEDGGPPPEQPADRGLGDEAMKDVGVQVLVRASAWDSDVAQAKAQAIMDALHGLRGAVVGSTRYLRVQAMSPEPLFAGFDTQNRPLFTTSYMLLDDVN